MKTLKTTFLLTALTLLLLFIGEAFGGARGMTIALVVAVLMNGVAYFFSDKIALASSGAQPISREESPRLYAVMERLCGKANLPMPKLYLIPQPAPNAFATGRNPSHASVAVTQGLLELMNDDELEGVIAHELSHVRNYDILTSSIAATLAAVLLQLGISRQREYQADASGANMVGQQYGLISALEKLGAYNQKIPSNIPPSTAALCIVAPFSPRQFLAGRFSTHPPLSDRIAELRNMTITR